MSRRGESTAFVAQIRGELGIGFESFDLQVHDAINADKLFLVTTPYCMAPVTRVNGLRIGDGAFRGPVFEHILTAWSEKVGVDIRAQILGTHDEGEGVG